MDRTMLTLRKVLRENDFETFIEKIEKIENLKITPLLLRRQYCPAIDDDVHHSIVTFISRLADENTKESTIVA
ncbi:hypothetical protein [Bifidobacterium pseudocatenulatum]|jgi:hypothetical protein|uniref:hypothetical protein n=1 Tax=Bifidobacterium pseudocatenulatum TaxID=28026 RepID=UPI00080BE8B4|nr:hypothetical protein [Bifidobacterium pseudocatenulatum]MCB4875410.1 hypothetical protein [Bifidobacterium pseudocatenulatum]MCB4898885.1 hypothetical protein [Bifidobacterium pseudocatenulatum]